MSVALTRLNCIYQFTLYKIGGPKKQKMISPPNTAHFPQTCSLFIDLLALFQKTPRSPPKS